MASSLVAVASNLIAYFFLAHDVDAFQSEVTGYPVGREGPTVRTQCASAT